MAVRPEEQGRRQPLGRLARQGPQAIPGEFACKRFRLQTLTYGIQHRFVATTLLSTGGELAAKLAQNLGYAVVSGIGESVLKAAFGDYLRNF
jgi:hypothetical protein